MKKLLLLIMMLVMSVIGTAAKKTLNKSFEGQYVRSTNTETTNDNTAGVSNNETETPNTPNLNNTGSFFNQGN